MQFGILAPEDPISIRRQQNLGLAAAVRHFNDRAVPGIGGMWFAMPILWSVLAVSIAEKLGIPALAVGNAIEARVMKQVIKVTKDRRVRGTRKLESLNDWSFANLKRRGTYVVQPIRMAMVQPLVELGFVQGSRYGAFRIHTAGHAMLRLPEIEQCHDRLLSWAKGGSPHGLDAALGLLSPTEPLLKSAGNLIYARLVEGQDEGARRRRNLVALGTGPNAQDLRSSKPLDILDDQHQVDLRAGVAFIDLRDAALKVLRDIEKQLLALRDNNQQVRLSAEDALKSAGGAVEQLRHLANQTGALIKVGREDTSARFLSEILESSDKQLLQNLAQRDRTVITWREGNLCLGPAASEAMPEVEAEDENRPPPNDQFAPQLFRLHNLHYLATELRSAANPSILKTLGEAVV
jgi:hypothetical protein